MRGNPLSWERPTPLSLLAAWTYSLRQAYSSSFYLWLLLFLHLVAAAFVFVFALPLSSVTVAKTAAPRNGGVVLIEVYDILEGGNKRHRALMD